MATLGIFEKNGLGPLGVKITLIYEVIRIYIISCCQNTLIYKIIGLFTF
jgi:hypothetical protein